MNTKKQNARIKKSPQRRNGVSSRVSSSLKGLITSIFALAIVSVALLIVQTASASDPTGGTLSPASSPVTWNGLPVTYANPVDAAEGTCQDGVNCDTFKLTISGTPADWAGKLAHIEINWTSPTFDYALSVHKGTVSDPSVAYSDNSITAPRNWEAVDINPAETGTGDYTVHVIYFTTSEFDTYKGTASVTAAPAPQPTPTPAPLSSETAPRYFNYKPPTGLGTDAGEPSIGVNWKTGKVFFVSYTQTLRTTFDDSSSPARAIWEDKSVPTHVTSLDPILYTDSQTGRTFSSQLAGATSLMSFTDNDGESWTPSQGAGIAASVDHQTIGGGPYHAPLPAGAVYPNVIYYCSQDAGADASCAASYDGGLTFGPAMRIYTALDCDGLHGHIKVGPDGTAYLPVATCGDQAVVVSEDNGLTWELRRIPNSGENSSDPSVGIGSDGTVYFAFADSSNRARVAVSHDKGKTWENDFDIGAPAGVKSSVFPSAVAGDPDRAAVFFLGSSTGGLGATGGTPSDFNGTWYGYISTTYDGGKTWVTVNATPNDPVQRGPICDKGTLGCSGKTRNLLDFNDLTVDKQGRVLAAFADGCVTDACIQGRDFNGDNRIDGNDNDGSAIATIIRWAGGKGLFKAYDVQLVSAVPAPPQVVASLDDTGTVGYVSWSTPDDGGSPITGYKVYRGAIGGSEALVASLGLDQHSYTDAQSGANAYYRVSATNVNGEGDKSSKTAPTLSESPCKGAGVTVLTDAGGDSLDQNASHDIRSLQIAEPYFADGSNKLIFTLKMADMSGTLTPSTTWRIYFTGADAKGYFVDMRTDTLGAVSYKYGTYIHNADNTAGTATTVGDADAGSKYDPQTGAITLVVSNSKIGSPKAGDKLSRIFVRVPVVAVVPDNANYSDPLSSVAYTLVGNAACQASPAAPASLTATAGKREVSLSWQDRSSNEESFLIERSTSVSSGYTQIATVGAGTTTYLDQGVVKKTTYYYRVRAANSGGKSTYSNVASAYVK